MSSLAQDMAAALDPVVFGHNIGFDAEPWQAGLLRSRARRRIVACARQVGKTETTSILAVHTALYRPGSLVLLISPTQRQSDEMLRRCRAVYRRAGKPVKAVGDSASTLELENGSRIVSLPGTDNTRSFAAVTLLVVDEASRVEDEIYASVLPMVASDGTMIVLSTPWGQRGWFYNLWSDTTNPYERHKVSVYESAQWSADRIAEVRGSVGSYMFASDYEVVFGDTEQQVFSTQAVRAAFTSAVQPLFLEGDPS